MKRTFFSRLARTLGLRRREEDAAFSSHGYWNWRYESGGTSGAGSYGRLSTFKADVLNELVDELRVADLIEFGCGDGNQLTLARYPRYHGYDVSDTAIALCRSRFAEDPTKRFSAVADYAGETADMALSLDVIFHLVEDRTFADYMHRLFDSARRFVVIYSSDTDAQEPGEAKHVRHRKFSDWVAANEPGWSLLRKIPIRYPYLRGDGNTSFSDFFVYGKSCP
jgi:trans-aconitate methyltransferase